MSARAKNQVEIKTHYEINKQIIDRYWEGYLLPITKKIIRHRFGDNMRVISVPVNPLDENHRCEGE